MKQKRLEMLLERIPPFPAPKAELEQYRTPAGVAAEVVYTAVGLGDVEGKRVADLGCGTGALAIGAALLGAARVVAIDVDEAALGVARSAAGELDAKVEFVRGDVSTLSGSFDTILTNPPFGAQKKGADVPFFEKAASAASGAIYTFYNPPSREFVHRWFLEHGWEASMEKNYKFKLGHIFQFHTRESKVLEVGLLRLVPRGKKG